MPSPAKDALSEATTPAGLVKNEAQGTQSSNAAGAEIPVIVHASRYSAASKGAGKLPPVHEETRTVIIFPQGAVVRLSAMVTPGELVVLTNRRTGADVICRVTSVKTQPGIQNYVHLEFTQRALDFWEETPASEPGNSIAKPPVTALPAVPPPAPAPIASGYKPPTSRAQEAQPKAKTSVPAVEVKSAPAPSPKVTLLADVPAAGSKEASATALAAQSQVSEITAAPASAQRQAHFLPSRTPRLQPFEAAIPHEKKASKTIVWFAIAAVILLAFGVGGSVLLRQERGMSVAPQVSNPPVTATPAPLPVPSESEAPIVKTSGQASSLEPVANTSAAKSSPLETPAQPAPVRAAVGPPKTEVQPQPVTRPNLNVGRISPPKVKRAAQLNPSEPPPVLPADANALPSVIGESVVNTTAHSNPLTPAEPAAPAPVKGGQLQQPKLLSSVAAVYPPLARAQRVQGDVTIDALIDATGKVAATNVISGSPLLQKAAIDSLRLWKYQPARLNGEPIPIHINVTIAFHLQ
jgi:periplasmic protein TonB